MVAGMPKWRNGRTIFQNMLFGMPATIHAKNWLSIKNRGDLQTAYIGLAHSPIDFSQKHYFYAKKASENVKKIIFWNKSHVRHAGMQPKMEKEWVLCSYIILQHKTCQINLMDSKLSKNNYPNKLHTNKWQFLIFPPVLVPMSHIYYAA